MELSSPQGAPHSDVATEKGVVVRGLEGKGVGDWRPGRLSHHKVLPWSGWGSAGGRVREALP